MIKYSRLLSIIFFLSNGYLFAQLSLFPPAMFIDASSRTGEITVMNTTKEVREVTLESIFGYIDYDSLGNKVENYKDSISLSSKSLVKYMKIFPSKLIIPPNERQTIRVFLKNLPADLPDGTYWTRFGAISSPVSAQVDTFTKGNTVNAAVVLKTRMISAVFYQKGDCFADISFDFKKVWADSANINIMFNSELKGNSPYWGQIKYKIYDENNDLIHEAQELMTFYKSSLKNVKVNKNKMTPGNYKMEYIISNDRTDMPEGVIFKKSKLEKTINFKVN